MIVDNSPLWRDPSYVFPDWAPRRMADLLYRITWGGWLMGDPTIASEEERAEWQRIAADLADLLADLRDAAP